MLVAMGLGGTQRNKQIIASMFEKMGGEVWADFGETLGDDFSKKYRTDVDLREIYMIQVLIFV